MAARPRTRTTSASYIALILAHVFWAGNYVFAPVVLAEISPVQLVTLRWAGAVPLLLVIAQVMERPQWRDAVREWPRHVAQSLIGIIGYPILLYAGLLTVRPLDASVMGATNPALILIAAAIIARERPGRRVVLGAALSIVGALIIISRGDPGEILRGQFVIGDVWILISVLMWTLYSVNGRGGRTPPVTATALQAVFATVVMVPIMQWMQPVDWGSLDAPGWGALVFITIFPTALGFLCWNMGVVGVGASRSGVFINTIMVFTAVIGLFLGETVSLVQILGGLVVFSGVYVSTRPRGVPLLPHRMGTSERES